MMFYDSYRERVPPRKYIAPGIYVVAAPWARHLVFSDGSGGFDEAEHPREADGKFAKSGEAKVATADDLLRRDFKFNDPGNPPWPKEKRNNCLKLLREKLKTGNPEKIAKAAACVMQGVWDMELPLFGKSKVFVGGGFIKEAAKYCYCPRSHHRYSIEQQRKNVARQLTAYSLLGEVMKDGNCAKRWKLDPKHHPNDYFTTFLYKIPKTDTLISLDIKINKEIIGKQPKAHNMSSTFNPGFNTKLKHLMTDQAIGFEVIRVDLVEQKTEKPQSRE